MPSRVPVSYLLVCLCSALVLVACQSVSPTPAVKPSPTATPVHIGLVGRPIRAHRADVYRLMEDGKLRHIADPLTYRALAYQPGDLLTVPSEQINAYPLGTPLSRWMTGRQDRALYYLQNGTRYVIGDATMLRRTGAEPTDVAQVADSFLSSFPIVHDAVPISLTKQAESLCEITNENSVFR
jgi:hypothetical protein